MIEYERLYAAQQALAQSLEHGGSKPPCDMVMGTQADSEDCLAGPRQPSS